MSLQPVSPASPAAVRPAALVIAGTGPVGAEIVYGLAARGYAVAIHAHAAFREARGLAEGLVAAGVPALAVTADLRDEGALRAMVHRVVDHFGRIDAVVTCVAFGRGRPLEEVTADELRTQFDVHCVGIFVVAQEAGIAMAAQDTGGGIVLVGDAEASRAAPGRTAVVAGQGALPALAATLARELAARNRLVRVNAVLAGPADGPRPPTELPSGRVADAVLFLLSNDGVNGACVAVDSGRWIG